MLPRGLTGAGWKKLAVHWMHAVTGLPTWRFRNGCRVKCVGLARGSEPTPRPCLNSASGLSLLSLSLSLWPSALLAIVFSHEITCLNKLLNGAGNLRFGFPQAEGNDSDVTRYITFPSFTC